MTEHAPSRTQRLAQTMRGIQRRAEAASGGVRATAIIYTMAALVLWLVLFVGPLQGSSSWLLFVAITTGLVLLIPAGIVFLFHLGLRALIALPDRFVDAAGESRTQAGTVYEAALRQSEQPATARATSILKALWAIREIVMESRDLLLNYAAVYRLVNPLVLIVVGAAFIAGALVVAAAFIGVLIAVL